MHTADKTNDDNGDYEYVDDGCEDDDDEKCNDTNHSYYYLWLWMVDKEAIG